MQDALHATISRNRHFLIFAFVFSVFVNLLMLTGPLFMLQVYDRVLGSRSEETLVALLVLVLGLFMGPRAAVVVGTTLLLTVVGTLLFMAIFSEFKDPRIFFRGNPR